MKTKFILSALMAAALFGGCSKDVTEEMPSDGNRVVFTLGGSTRAAGDNDTHSTLASTDDEKKISSLIAVAFGSDGAYYKSFEAVYDDGQKTATFDLEKNGTYDIYFVANADTDLKGALMTLTDQNSDQSVTAADLASLVVTQALSDDTAKHDFVMLSDGPKKVVSQHGTTVNGGLVMMRRLAVRFDLVNAAEGVEITSVKFVNRTKASRLDASNDMNFASGSLYEDKTYDNLGLAGNYQTPAKYEAKIYSYENVNTGSDNLPSLEITYTMDGLTLTHTVKFYDSTSENGTTPLALKRNYLYRIVLTKPMDVEFTVTVDDWDSAAAFEITDLPFEDTSEQAEMNAALKVNMFNGGQFAKNVSVKDRTILSFFPSDYMFSEADKSSYISMEDLDAANAALAEFTYIGDGSKYRLPTIGEFELLTPNQILQSDNTVYLFPYWNTNQESTSSKEMADGPFMETIYLKNDDERHEDTSHPDDTDSEYTLQGESQLKLGDTPAVDFTENNKVYELHPVYGLRFKGTSQYAAYRWELKKISSNPDVGEMTIKIKALKQDDVTTTIDMVADDTNFWKEGSYLEYKFSLGGSSGDAMQHIGSIGYVLSSTMNSTSKAVRYFGIYPYMLICGKDLAYNSRFPLFLVKADANK